MCKWKNDRAFSATIMDTGEKELLKNQMEALTKKGADGREKKGVKQANALKRSNKIVQVLNQISIDSIAEPLPGSSEVAQKRKPEETRSESKKRHKNLDVVQETETPQLPEARGNDTPANWERYWMECYEEETKKKEKENERRKKYQNKVKTLQAKIKGSEVLNDEVEIGLGVKIKKWELDTIKTISSSAPIFARNLMRLLFSEEEILDRSLFGRGCNANKNQPIKESIDPGRRDAIILTTLNEYCRDSTMKKAVRTVVYDSLSDYLREKTKKHNSSKQ